MIEFSNHSSAQTRRVAGRGPLDGIRRFILAQDGLVTLERATVTLGIALVVVVIGYWLIHHTEGPRSPAGFLPAIVQKYQGLGD